MAEQINGGFKDMSLDDAFAIASYLKSIPAIHNSPSAAPPPAQPLLPTTGEMMFNLSLWGLLFAFGGVLLLGGVVVLRGSFKRIK